MLAPRSTDGSAKHRTKLRFLEIVATATQENREHLTGLIGIEPLSGVQADLVDDVQEGVLAVRPRGVGREIELDPHLVAEGIEGGYLETVVPVKIDVAQNGHLVRPDVVAEFRFVLSLLGWDRHVGFAAPLSGERP